MPKVSIIIPVYNAQDYLERCLDSVCSQTLKDIEIICVNDCSTDCSLEILQNYAKKDARINIIDCKKNGGESKARNLGLDNVTGEYIAFLDNDDTVDFDFYEKLYAEAKSNNADIAKARTHIINYNGKDSYDNLNKEIVKNNSILYFYVFWWSAIYKTSFIKANNIKLPEGIPLGGDLLFLNNAVLNAKNFAVCDDTFYHYYRREDSGDSKILPLEKIQSVFEIYENIIENINAKKYEIQNKNGLEYIISHYFMDMLNYTFRGENLKCLDFVIDKLFVVYDKVYDKSQLHKNLLKLNCIEIEYIRKNDKTGLKEFCLINNSQKKLVTARLRYKINILK